MIGRSPIQARRGRPVKKKSENSNETADTLAPKQGFGLLTLLSSQPLAVTMDDSRLAQRCQVSLTPLGSQHSPITTDDSTMDSSQLAQRCEVVLTPLRGQHPAVTADLRDAADAPEGPSFPLLWAARPPRWYDLHDTANPSLGLDGKGVYLRHLRGGTLASAHRLDVPFPLRSAVCSRLYRGRGNNTATAPDGAALPLLAGAIHTDADSDPVEADVTRYWMLQRAASFALTPAYRQGRGLMPAYKKVGVSRESMVALLGQINEGQKLLPNAARNLKNALPLVHFLTKNPVFKGWDENHNWLFGGGSLALMRHSQKLIHTSGTSIAVAALVPGEEEGDDSSGREDASSRLWAEDEALLSWPDEETVLQVAASDQQLASSGLDVAAVRGVSSARFYLRLSRRLTCVDDVSPGEPLSAVCCHPQTARRWAYADTAGRCTVRDGILGKSVHSVQLPHVERPTGWFGLDAHTQRHRYHAASWERLYSVDCREPTPVVLFRLSDNSRLFTGADRVHAVRGAAARSHLTLLTTSRHLVVLDERQPRTPWLCSRLTLPPDAVYLSSCPAARSGSGIGSGTGSGTGTGTCLGGDGGSGGGGDGSADRELVTVAGQTDGHVQAIVYDWSAGAELGVSRLLGCARPPLEAGRDPGLETTRRLQLKLTGLVADRPGDGSHNCVYTSNSAGDVFVHPLVPEDGVEPDDSGGRGRARNERAPEADRQASNTRHDRQRQRKKHRLNDTNRASDQTESVTESVTAAEAPPPQVSPFRVSREDCERLVRTWSETVEQQRRHKTRITPLRCDSVVRWPGPALEGLLSPPPLSAEDSDRFTPPRWSASVSAPPRRPPERTPQRVNRWLSRLSAGDGGEHSDTDGPAPGTPRTPAGGGGDAPDSGVAGSRTDDGGTSTDVSTPPRSEIDEMLSYWASDGDQGSDTDAPLSVADELTAHSLRITGSQRRSRVPRWQKRRRTSSETSNVSSSSRAPSSPGRSSSAGRAPSSRPASAGSGAISDSASSASAPASSLVTPARPLPAVSQAAAFQQFNMDLFDD